MSGSGRVVSVTTQNEPRRNTLAQRVVVQADAGRWVAFFIPIGAAPAVRDAISWGPHHAWWGDTKVAKIGWTFDPDAPLP